MRAQASRYVVMAPIAMIGICALFLTACASLPVEKVQEESGYYYGRGADSSPAAAAAEAKKDLIVKALTKSRERDGIKERIDVTEEVVASFSLPNFKVYAQSKTEGMTHIVYRIKESEWDAYQAARMKAAYAEIKPRIAALSPEGGRTLAERVLEAAAILDRLNRQALADVLREDGPGAPLVADIIEKICVDQIAGIRVRMDMERGFADKDTRFSGRFEDAPGRALGPMPVRARWSVRGGESHVAIARASSDGSFVLEFPKDRAFLDHSVSLTVSSGFSDSAYGSSVLREADDNTSGEYSYQVFEDVKAYFAAESLIPGGTFAVGSLDRDKRAARKEAPRQATVSDFYMDKYLVTNALYDMFLGDTKAAEAPEYWDNPEYNQDDQPVIGVRYEDAVRFAVWLSEQLGVAKRLPTEAEWERAARGGRDVIYPWGDQSPDEGELANYNGNGKYTGVSPVGCYEEGKNAYGLYDMAGNVWQWTSTPRDPGKGSGGMIVKGGSWMDGPADLRISNRRDLDPRLGYVDVGIRLVREATE